MTSASSNFFPAIKTINNNIDEQNKQTSAPLFTKK